MKLKTNNPSVLSNEDNFAFNLTEYTTNTNAVLDTSTQYIAERYIDIYAKNRMPSMLSTNSPYSIESFRRDLQFLNRKLEAVRKTLSIWESYRITDVATSKDELEYKLGTLPPNSGLVVNFAADNLMIGDKSYSQGDVIFNDFQSNQYVLKSYSGGYYYPCQMVPLDENGTVVKIVYAFATQTPIDKTETLSDERLAEPATNLELSMSKADTQDRYYFNDVVPAGEDVELPALFTKNDQNQDQLIRPIVAWFLSSNDVQKLDRIYFDIEWTYNEDAEGKRKIILTNNTPLPCYCEVR